MVEVKKRKRRTKLTLEQIRQFFLDNNCVLVTKKYQGAKQKLKYKCNVCGHINVAAYNNLYRFSKKSKNKYFCNKCYLNKIGFGENLKKIELRNKLYSITDAAKWLGVDLKDFYNHVRLKKTLPEPTRQGTQSGLSKFYLEEDLKEIKNMVEKNIYNVWMF